MINYVRRSYRLNTINLCILLLNLGTVLITLILLGLNVLGLTNNWWICFLPMLIVFGLEFIIVCIGGCLLLVYSIIPLYKNSDK